MMATRRAGNEMSLTPATRWPVTIDSSAALPHNRGRVAATAAEPITCLEASSSVSPSRRRAGRSLKWLQRGLDIRPPTRATLPSRRSVRAELIRGALIDDALIRPRETSKPEAPRLSPLLFPAASNLSKLLPALANLAPRGAAPNDRYKAGFRAQKSKGFRA